MKNTFLASLAISVLPALAHADTEIYGSLRAGIQNELGEMALYIPPSWSESTVKI